MRHVSKYFEWSPEAELRGENLFKLQSEDHHKSHLHHLIKVIGDKDVEIRSRQHIERNIRQSIDGIIIGDDTKLAGVQVNVSERGIVFNVSKSSVYL